MPKKVFIFDLDETLLCASAALSRLNAVEKAPSSYDPYHGFFSDAASHGVLSTG